MDQHTVSLLGIELCRPTAAVLYFCASMSLKAIELKTIEHLQSSVLPSDNGSSLQLSGTTNFYRDAQSSGPSRKSSSVLSPTDLSYSSIDSLDSHTTGISDKGLDPGIKGRRSKRQRALRACARCKQRKQRCDNAYPACSNCVKGGVKCETFDGDALASAQAQE